ncbi:hypothetical protein [Ornithinimicrobium ciconiae]|uniref:hypothetical protein n=1 Tax=Ornithinimicrobium ciconiae TaxID=2594265 RepID=UPI002AA2B267|nr:hypothetical protein [Ornithinimicrobium ciconiae]
MVVFYGLNGIDLQAPDGDAFDLVIAVASGTADHQMAARHLAKWYQRTQTACGGLGSV